MTSLDRIAEFNGFTNWEQLLNKAKTTNIPFNVPTYFHARGSNFLMEMLQKLKDDKFKIEVNDGACILVNTEKPKKKKAKK